MRGFALAGACALVAAWAAPASAYTVEIGYANTAAGAPTVVATPSIDPDDGTFSWTGTIGGFKLSANVGAFDPAEPEPTLATQLLFSKRFVANSTLYFYITEYDIDSPGQRVTYDSTFTSEPLPAGWSATIKTFIDPTNHAFGATEAIGSANFTGLGQSRAAVSDDPTGLYSITIAYIVRTSTAAMPYANLTADVKDPVPEVSTFAMLGVGFAGMGLAGVGRRKIARYAI